MLGSPLMNSHLLWQLILFYFPEYPNLQQNLGDITIDIRYTSTHQTSFEQQQIILTFVSNPFKKEKMWIDEMCNFNFVVIHFHGTIEIKPVNEQKN